MHVIFTQSNETLEKIYATFTILMQVVHRYFILNHALSNSGSLVKLVQACLSAGKVRQSYFNHCGGPVKHVQACLSARKGGECSF